MARYEDILSRLTPKERAIIERRMVSERGAAFGRGFKAASTPKPVGRGGRHHGAQYTPKSGRFKGVTFRNRDEYERVSAFGRSLASRSRHMTPEQMGRLTRRAAELGISGRELWAILFGTP